MLRGARLSVPSNVVSADRNPISSMTYPRRIPPLLHRSGWKETILSATEQCDLLFSSPGLRGLETRHLQGTANLGRALTSGLRAGSAQSYTLPGRFSIPMSIDQRFFCLMRTEVDCPRVPSGETARLVLTATFPTPRLPYLVVRDVHFQEIVKLTRGPTFQM